ncbi:MAG: type I glyceraldehyde-3-phosphate dehydrogenase [Deltaproteobacteria bacterium]|nr:type I glyceraldehyde-3-phosphate dehydrogenase [Deltaproteobacteria bacterium]
MALRIGINGFGRIGRCVARILMENRNVEIVAVNDVTDAKTLAYLFKYDSVHGTLKYEVRDEGNAIVVGDRKIEVLSVKSPEELPWKDMKVDVVVESTGKFLSREDASKHIKAGAKKVILSAPPKDKDIPTFVYGVNHTKYDKSMDIISNASCTTNCLAPIAKVINDNFKIVKGYMTTIHSYTNDQRILDLPHKDLRRARAAAMSMIPTTTGAAKAVGMVLPELKGKLDGVAIRVPTPNVSLVDLSVLVEKNTTRDEVNSALKMAAEGDLKGILEYCDLPLVSIDFNHSLTPSIVDALSTAVMDGNLVKVYSWYDNEWGYSNQLIKMMEYVGSQL